MKRFLFLIIGLSINLIILGHPWKPSHYVIVDTDGGIDDLMSLTMLLASPDVRVLAVTVSPGVLSADNAYLKVRSLLDGFHHEGLPAGINRESNYISKNFPVALQCAWGDETGITSGSAPDASMLIDDILKAEKTKISFICLGSMSTAWMALRKSDLFGSHVKEIIWSAGGANDTEGFNYSIDKNASGRMLKQEIPVKVVRSYNSTVRDFWDENLIRSMHSINTVYAEKIAWLLDSDNLKNHKFSYAGTDEMAAIFLHYPGMFLNKTAGYVSDYTPSDTAGLKDSVIRILKGATVARNQVIRDLPTDPSFYFDDLKPAVNEIIAKYGIDEWTSGVIANELHRHLGVFAIIGVKMGIRAREYFNTGVDEFSLTSFAGSTPPLSCMNDGLQVSTGATPGHGLLTVRNDTSAVASAEFTYMNHKIRLTLKPDIAEKISSELSEINFIYGLDSNIYWELVRKNTIKYWRDMDRHEIFRIELIH
jgi:pyrimidine-specific ribonucleoside hydrolase